MNRCSKIPCGRDMSGQCQDVFCPAKMVPFSHANPVNPAIVPMGCICPPTSEQTCESPFCPRQNPMTRAAKAAREAKPADVR